MHPSVSEPLRFQPAELPVRASTAAGTDLWREWDVLAARLGAAPCMRPGWFSAWHRAYGDGELRLLTVHYGDRLAGVLPIEKRGRTTLSPTNTHSPLFGPVAENPDVEGALASELRRESQGRVDLCYVDPRTSWFATLCETLRSARRSVLTETVARSPYVATEGGWDAYRASLPGRFLKDLRRRQRRLEERGLVEIGVHSAVDGLEGALDEFVRIESSGWKVEEGTAIASRDASRRFYAEIARWAAERGWLRLTFLRLDGRAIAAELDLHCAGAVYALKSGFDPDYRAFAPGQLLTQDCLRRAFSEGLASYEFLGNDEAYKLSWTATTRERARVQSFPRTVSGDLGALARHHARPVLRRLRRR